MGNHASGVGIAIMLNVTSNGKPRQLFIGVAVIIAAFFPLALHGCLGGANPQDQAGGASAVGLSFPAGYAYDKTTHALYAPSGRNDAALPPYVTGITLTISGEGMETANYPVNLSTLEVSFTVSPGLRTFSILVTTNIGLSFSDSVTLEVVSGSPLFLSFSLVINAPPSIDGVSATPGHAKPGDVIALGCSASDPDPLDKLSYQWSGPSGFAASGQAASYTIPGYGSFTFTCEVSDGRGGTASASASVIAVKPNKPPVITSVQGSPPCISVGNTTLTCNAYDPDGDPLAYSWKAGANGGSSSGPTIVCLCGSPGASTATGTVTDGKSTPVSQAVNY